MRERPHLGWTVVSLVLALYAHLAMLYWRREAHAARAALDICVAAQVPSTPLSNER